MRRPALTTSTVGAWAASQSRTSPSRSAGTVSTAWVSRTVAPSGPPSPSRSSLAKVSARLARSGPRKVSFTPAASAP